MGQRRRRCSSVWRRCERLERKHGIGALRQSASYLSCRIRGQRIAHLVLQSVVENDQNQAPAARVSRHRKIPRDFESNLIRIGAGATVTLGRGSGGYVGDGIGIGRWFERAFRADKSVDQIVETLARKPDLHVTNIFSTAANNNLSFVVREARRLHLGDPDCHSFPLQTPTIPIALAKESQKHSRKNQMRTFVTAVLSYPSEANSTHPPRAADHVGWHSPILCASIVSFDDIFPILP